MKQEIEVASEWWSASLHYWLGKHELRQFKDLMKQGLEEKFRNHWYCNEPLRGSGFRSLLVDEVQTDGLIKNALLTVIGLCASEHVIANLPRNVLMTINPGRVTVKFLTNNSVLSLYSNDPERSASSPPAEESPDCSLYSKESLRLTKEKSRVLPNSGLIHV